MSAHLYYLLSLVQTAKQEVRVSNGLYSQGNSDYTMLSRVQRGVSLFQGIIFLKHLKQPVLLIFLCRTVGMMIRIYSYSIVYSCFCIEMLFECLK